MACHEIAALRLGLMQVLGIADEAERQHEIAELGDGAEHPGPIRALAHAQDLGSAKRFFEAALTDLHARVSGAPANDPQLPYLRSLMVLTRKVELELGAHLETLTRFYRDLEEMHDFVHEIYPAE